MLAGQQDDKQDPAGCGGVPDDPDGFAGAGFGVPGDQAVGIEGCLDRCRGSMSVALG